MLSKIVNALSPLELFNAGQMKKLQAARGFNGKMGALRSNLQQAMVRKRAIDAKYGADARIRPGDYFRGYNFEELNYNHAKYNKAGPSSALMAKRADRAKIRRGAALALGGYAISNALTTEGGTMNRMGDFAFDTALHAGAANLLYRISPIAGLAYGGISAINTMRSGDNIGPF